MLKLLPGVVDTNARDAPSWNLLSGLTINGRNTASTSRTTASPTSYRGTSGTSPRPPSTRLRKSAFSRRTSRPSTAEVRGASITVVTRSGSKTFRGSAAFYKRDDALNGNEFLRRAQCGLGQTEQCAAPLYAFDNFAWTLGGPVLVPGTTFNKRRNKLFFFWSQDILSRTDAGTLNQRRMPTALERTGDFSQTFDNQSRLIYIRDPMLSGLQQPDWRTGMFRGQQDPRQPHRFNGTGAPEPVPDAECFRPDRNQPVQLHVPDRDGLATKRPGAARGLEHRSDDDRVRPPSVRPRETCGWRGDFRRGLWVAPDASKFDTDSVSYVNTLLHTFSPTTSSAKSRSA